ncbi:hypothetical protein HUK65_15910 [Rhodobacteraceae bacterium 2376]|uniref:Lipoprotein n=1 Tax=Rhabdonatronobacter sediminivivens TaxID=2743469 RepID=A0A7Z0I203_9RHOB|nr:hypothetical protein [Rhabdonatronobacter sediminivivens]NYS26471.1 hypothetical protein [Rhabdonatronobacter sediminivivens]
MKKRLFLIAAMAISLSACEQTVHAASDDALTQAVVGRTLTQGPNALTVNPDGTLTGQVGQDGMEAQGTWAVRNGQWCRTFTTPQHLVGTACQDFELVNGTITFITPQGPSAPWTIN